MRVKIYFNDNLVGDYLSDEWKIKYGSKKFIAELKDELMNWQDIWFSGIKNNEANTYETFFDKLNFQTNKINISPQMRMEIKQISCPDGHIEAQAISDAQKIFLDLIQGTINKRIDGEIGLVD